MTTLTLPYVSIPIPQTGRPILKWAGGKKQLIAQLKARFPPDLSAGKITRYVEPFVGGGAVFFYVVQNYSLRDYFLYDINEELILLYQVVQKNVRQLIEKLGQLETRFLRLSFDAQRDFFYDIRSAYNSQRSDINFSKYSRAWVERAVYIIFLNRTCFNGLFRVNAQGGFNVPFGGYKNPTICDAENLLIASRLLCKAVIRNMDFSAATEVINAETFVYFDPPYRPVSKTSSFTSYSRYDFDDAAQKRLAQFYKQLAGTGAKLMLSNSDPTSENPQDDFFERLYGDFTIQRVNATRMINANGAKRGPVPELLVTNY